ncbi:MAG: 50S ribosomal protein L23 [Candidatus Thermoplasmatota archaeon]|jgi:large subunit ribosomal protein L23|nr:50S ribosomal protein L23 [Candidatus Thermoplasmatota archaeon]
MVEKSPYKILFHPHVTEKAMDHMDKGNKLEFLVHKNATKSQIKRAFEKIFEVEVVSVNTRNLPDGKHAVIKLSEKYSAEEIGTRIGIF